jgi:hypothetical protein
MRTTCAFASMHIPQTPPDVPMSFKRITQRSFSPMRRACGTKEKNPSVLISRVSATMGVASLPANRSTGKHSLSRMHDLRFVVNDHPPRETQEFGIFGSSLCLRLGPSRQLMCIPMVLSRFVAVAVKKPSDPVDSHLRRGPIRIST